MARCPAGLGTLRADSTLRLDIQQQARPAAVTLKGVGCDEFSTGPGANRPLTLCEVGPAYLCRGVLASTPAAAEVGATLFPNPGRGRCMLTFAGTPATLLVRDALGRLVYSVPAISSGTALNLSALAPGVYHYQRQRADAGARGGRFVLE